MMSLSFLSLISPLIHLFFYSFLSNVSSIACSLNRKTKRQGMFSCGFLFVGRIRDHCDQVEGSLSDEGVESRKRAALFWDDIHVLSIDVFLISILFNVPSFCEPHFGCVMCHSCHSISDYSLSHPNLLERRNPLCPSVRWSEELLFVSRLPIILNNVTHDSWETFGGVVLCCIERSLLLFKYHFLTFVCREDDRRESTNDMIQEGILHVSWKRRWS